MGVYNLFISENESKSQTTDWGVGLNVSSLTNYFATSDHGNAKRPIKKVTFEMSSNVTTNWGYATIQMKACFANSNSDANYESKSERFLYKEFRTNKEPDQTHSVDVTKYFNRNYPYSITSEAKGYSQFWLYFNTTSANKKTYLIRYAKFVVTYEDDQTLHIAITPLNSGTIEGPGLSINGGWYVGSYVYESTNSFKAVPANNYEFSYWENLDTKERLYSNPLSLYHTQSYKYTAVFLKKYIITTLTSPIEGGTVTGGGEYYYGETIVLQATPTLGWYVSDWLKDGVSLETNADSIRPTVSENATYTAIFTPYTYTITFKDYDGTIIPVNGQNSQTVEYGKLPVEPPTPTRPSTPQHRYEFNGWSPAIESATRDIAYFAQYTEIEILYTITWLNYDGSLLKTYGGIPYGSIPVYSGDTPIRPSTAQYSYEFDGWDPPIDKVNGIVGDTVYVAKFKENLRNYSISVKDGIVTLLSGSKVGDNYEYGSILEITANEKEGYKFLGWSGNSSSTEKTIRYTVTSEATFEALYKKLQMFFKSIKMFNHSKNELISPLNPLKSGEEVIVEVKIAYE